MSLYENMSLVICFILLRLLPQALGEVPAIFVFGDSLFDSGNNNYLKIVSKANFAPYGIDFRNGPTGRFTNNRTVVDIFAEKLGLPYAPPYLKFVGKTIPQTGVNYASASCGILDETGDHLGKCLSLRKQVHYFKRTLRHLKSSSSDYLANSLFITSIGSNDFLNNYLQPQFYNTSSLTPNEFAKLLVDTLSDQLKRLYILGARKFVVFNVGPLGCIPAVIASNNSTGCVDAVNRLAILYNLKLGKRLPRLHKILSGSKFVLADTFNSSATIGLNPKKFGFNETKRPCCAVTNLGTCIPGGAVCRNRKEYTTFDAIHPTDAVYTIVANSCFDGSPSICSPLTLKQLAH